MPLGVVSSDQFDLEKSKIESEKNSKLIVIAPAEKGRNNKTETPVSVRALIAEEAITGTSIAEIAETFNVSKSSVSAYKNGVTSTAVYNDEKDKNLISHINKVKNRITKKASNLLITALDSMSPDKFSDISVRDAAAVAKDMAVIVDKMIGSNTNKEEKSNQLHIHLHAPNQKSDDSYGEVIEV